MFILAPSFILVWSWRAEGDQACDFPCCLFCFIFFVYLPVRLQSTASKIVRCHIISVNSVCGEKMVLLWDCKDYIWANQFSSLQYSSVAKQSRAVVCTFVLLFKSLMTLVCGRQKAVDHTQMMWILPQAKKCYVHIKHAKSFAVPSPLLPEVDWNRLSTLFEQPLSLQSQIRPKQ